MTRIDYHDRWLSYQAKVGNFDAPIVLYNLLKGHVGVTSQHEVLGLEVSVGGVAVGLVVSCGAQIGTRACSPKRFQYLIILSIGHCVPVDDGVWVDIMEVCHTWHTVGERSLTVAIGCAGNAAIMSSVSISTT